MVGANGMMMSAEEWYDVGNYEIKGNAFPRIALNLEPLTNLPRIASLFVHVHKFHFVY